MQMFGIAISEAIRHSATTFNFWQQFGYNFNTKRPLKYLRGRF